MPRNAAPTRAAILTAAVTLLREGGLPAFSIEAIATRAHVAKGLVLYHYESRAKLLEICTAAVLRDRTDRLAAAPRGRKGIGAVDALWQELLRQHADGTTRAWLSLAAQGGMRAGGMGGDRDVLSHAAGTLLDGCAAALAAGGEPAAVREAYEALSLALLNLEDDR